MDSESWLVIDETEKGSVLAPETGLSEACPGPAPAVGSGDAVAGERSGTEDATAVLQQQSIDLINRIGTAILGNESFKGVGDIPQLGLDALESQYAILQKQLTEIADIASSKSYSAIDRIKRDVRQMLAVLAESDEAGYTSTGNAEETERILNQELAGDKQFSTLETQVARTLIPKLVEARKPLFDGTDFKSWFSGVKPLFARELNPCDPEVYVCGIKIYSEPRIAALIDEFDAVAYRKWDDAENQLNKYFETRAARVKKYARLTSIISG